MVPTMACIVLVLMDGQEFCAITVTKLVITRIDAITAENVYRDPQTILVTINYSVIVPRLLLPMELSMLENTVKLPLKKSVIIPENIFVSIRVIATQIIRTYLPKNKRLFIVMKSFTEISNIVFSYLCIIRTLDANPCLCPDGFEGIHCEFKKGTVPDCTLDCQNDGVCVVGIHDPAEMDRMKHIWSKEDIDSHQRCLCKDGYGGPLCEASSEDCGGDACYHGGTCVETVITDTESGTSIKEFHCDCTTAGDGNNLYAGYYCQHPSTTFCSDVDENLFCTNKGTCKGDPLEGCDCPEGWTGFKCDYLDGNYFAEDDDDDDDYDDDDDDAYAAELCGVVYCFNNGKCVTTTIEQRDGTTTEEKKCDCSETFDGQHFFAGSSCQYK